MRRRTRRTAGGTRSRTGARRRRSGSIGLEATDRSASSGSSGPAGASDSSGVLPARRASLTKWSGVIRASSVTSSPRASGRGDRRIGADRVGPGAQHDPCRLRVAVQVPLAGRGRVAGHAEGPTHAHVSAEQPGEGRLAFEGQGEVRQRTERDQRDLTGETAGLLDDQVNPMAVGHRPGGRRELRMPDAARPVCLGCRLEWSHEGHLRPIATSMSVRPASSSTASVFVATWRALTLPDTHVTATRFASGEATAYSSARLSSMPVSTSRMMGMGRVTRSMLAERVPSSRQTGRVSRPARRRRAQVESDASISAADAGRIAVSPSPAADHAGRTHAPPRHRDMACRLPRPTCTTDASTSSRPPSARSDATPHSAASSRPTIPRSNEPQGKRTVTRSARPASGEVGQGLRAGGEEQHVGGAAPVGAPGRVGHRDAAASTPTTSAVGSAAARSRTTRPSPVPISTTTRSARAIRLVT